MKDFSSYIYISVALGIILPIILRSPKLESKDGSIRIQFGIFIKIILLIGFVFFLSATIFSLKALISGDETCDIWVVLIFMGFMILEGLCMFWVFRRKYILCKNEIVIIGLFGKKETYNIKDIKSAKLVSSDGIRLIFNNGKNFLILQLMSNYDVLINTLNENKILITNSKNQKMDIGW